MWDEYEEDKISDTPQFNGGSPDQKIDFSKSWVIEDPALSTVDPIINARTFSKFNTRDVFEDYEKFISEVKLSFNFKDKNEDDEEEIQPNLVSNYKFACNKKMFTLTWFN